MRDEKNCSLCNKKYKALISKYVPYVLKYMPCIFDKNKCLNGSPTQVQKIFPPAVNDKKEIWNEAGDVLAEKLFDKIVEMKFV